MAPTGITVEERTRTRSWSWGEVTGAAVARADAQAHLVLLDAQGEVLVALPCAGSADDAWLAAYLDARARARHPSADERGAHEGTRARLDDLLGTARPETR